MKKLAPVSILIAVCISAVMAQSADKKSDKYSIGDRGPAGGFIIYDKGKYSGGWRYLEAAPNDQSSGIKWSNGQFNFIGKTGTKTGAGKTNTARIISVQKDGVYAAKICADYRGGGKSDWFLPSKNELLLMKTVLNKNKANSLPGEFYWSSSEIDGSIAWLQPSGADRQYGDDKEFPACVRAVRAF